MDQSEYHDILYNDDPIGPYPTHVLKRVERPTNRIPGPIARVAQRDSVFARSFLGEHGDEIKREFLRMTIRYPIGAALVDLQNHINRYANHKNKVAAKKAPIPTDPRVLSRHLKSLGHFRGANFKVAAVLTSLELEVDGYVDFGLQNYGATCTICAEQCPSHAITRGPQTLHNGYYTWKLNDRACSDFDVLNKEGCVCGRCTKVCPWHRPDMDARDFAGWNGDLAWLHRTVDEQRERLIANDFVDPRERTGKWWLSLDEVDGELVIPTGRNQQKVCREYPLQ